MSRHYTAFQYEAAYKPRALKNWEVPKFYCDKAFQRYGQSKIIANTRGHLLPGVTRPQGSSWGSFIGTWSLPKYIDRKMAHVLSGADKGQEIRKCKTSRVPRNKRGLEHKDNELAASDKSIPVSSVQKKDLPVESPTEKADTPKEIHPDDEQHPKKKIMCPIHDLYDAKEK